MNREIKFRAWEKNLKQIIEVNNIDFRSQQINIGQAWRFFNEVELMQYTGLKDKNGKEIYEGDIVLVDNGIGYKAEIIWYRNAFTIQPECRGGTDIFLWQYENEELQVIGNIYENPELLEVNNEN